MFSQQKERFTTHIRWPFIFTIEVGRALNKYYIQMYFFEDMDLRVTTIMTDGKLWSRLGNACLLIVGVA